MSQILFKMTNELANAEKVKLSANISKLSHEKITQRNQFGMLHINLTIIQVYAATPHADPTQFSV